MCPPGCLSLLALSQRPDDPQINQRLENSSLLCLFPAGDAEVVRQPRLQVGVPPASILSLLDRGQFDDASCDSHCEIWVADLERWHEPEGDVPTICVGPRDTDRGFLA